MEKVEGDEMTEDFLAENDCSTSQLLSTFVQLNA